MISPEHALPVTVRLEPAEAGPRRYPIHLAPLDRIGGFMDEAGLRRGPVLLVTDDRVAPLYAGALEAALAGAGRPAHRITVPAGEATKSLEWLARIYDEALGRGIDRKTPLVALGGGVVGDLAGFAAASLLRGLPFVQVPTTLIAQVDSAIGGKTGINHPAGKNLIGAFHQPAFVLADPDTLGSLPEREWTGGLAEVVKHALIADERFFADLETGWTDVMARTPAARTLVVRRSAEIKAGVVSADERESGLRAILNFGHTFGHAVEKATGYGFLSHGEAVAVGMRAALHLSHALHPDLPLDRALALVDRLPVPPLPSSVSIETLQAAMQSDKKRDAARLRFVVLDRIGHAYVTADVDERLVRDAWAFAVRGK